jgi:acetoin utilization deacetylase AcuC-like enzyme
VILVSSDTEKNEEQGKQLSSDVMKKLNDAFLSYFDGSKPGKSTIDLSEKDAILDLIQSGVVEEKSSDVDKDTEPTKMIVIGEGFIEAGDETITYSDAPDMQTEPSTTFPSTEAGVPDVLSNAFADVSFQSVEIEIDDGGTADKDGEKGIDKDYSKTVSDILQKTPKVAKVSSYDHNSDSDAVNSKSDLTVSKQSTGEKPSLQTAIPKKQVLQQSTKTVQTTSVQKPVAGSVPKAPSATQVKPQVKTVAGKTSTPLVSRAGGNEGTQVNVSSVKPRVAQPAKIVPKPATSKIVPPVTPAPKPAVAAKKKVSNEPAAPVNIAFLYNEDHMKHDASLLSIITHEKPERIIKAMWYLEKNKVFNDGTCTLISDFRTANEEDLYRVHGKEYVSFVKSYSGSGGGFLGDSTYMTSGSYDIAKTAAGAAIQAGDLLVDGKFTHAFVLTRPPGHHASTQKYGGFCLFNNAAVLARHLQHNRKVGKVLILDWDAHAGDGTMEIFYEDPTVMLISLHRDPHGFYPRKGFSNQTGENAGKGYTMNVEMPAGSRNEEYLYAFDEAVIPMVEHFNPDFIVLSCGFDAHYHEMNIGLELDSDAYHQMTAKLHSVFKGPIAFLLEGGYHDFNGQLCHSVLSSLHGSPNPVHDQQEISSFKQNQQKQIFEEVQKKVAETKSHHPVLLSGEA